MNDLNSEPASKKYLLLVETAKKLFFKHGVRRVTVEEICKKANVSKVTFYKYFSDKMQLAEWIGGQLVRQGFARFDEINSMDLSFPEKIDLMTNWRIDFFSQMGSEFLEDVLNMEEINNEVKARYMKNIISAQEKGEIRADLSPELIWLASEKLNEIVKDGSWKTVFTDFQEFHRQIRKMYFYGLLEK